VRLRCAQSHFSAEAGVRLALICTVLFWSLATLTLRAEPPAREQIARWIKELGDDDYASREHASKQLWQAGATAESAVFEAVQSADPEVARRARVLAQKFRWGIYPDTQPRIVERIERYRSADESGKQALIKELFEMGAAGCTAILKIAAAEEDDVRPRVFQQIASDAAKAVPDLLLEGKSATLDQLLEIAIAAGHDSAILNYAASSLMRGKLKERIQVYTERAATAVQGPADEMLLYLHRANGDLPAAGKIAEKLQRQDLEESLLMEAGDWKTLATLDGAGDGRPLISLGFKAAYHRLADDAAAFEETVKKIRTSSEVTGPLHWGAWAGARALLLNDRPQDALDVLAHHRRTAVFELLCAQMRFREAFALVDNVKSEPRPEIDVELD